MKTPDLPPGARPLSSMNIRGLLKEIVAIYAKGYLFFLLASLSALAITVLACALVVGIYYAFFIDSMEYYTEIDAPGAILGVYIYSLLIFCSSWFWLWVLASAPTAMAVSQHYATRRIPVGRCFQQAWRKTFSLGIVATALVVQVFGAGILLAFTLFSVVTAPVVWILPFVIPAALFCLYTIWAFAPECVMIEGCGPFASLGRSFNLVRSSFWRTCWLNLVFTVIPPALMITVMMALLGSVNVNPGDNVIASVSAVSFSLLVPVGWIARTLIYYRLRKRTGLPRRQVYETWLNLDQSSYTK